MPANVKEQFLAELARRFPASRKMAGSQSLFDLGEGQGRMYIRYSKVHSGGRTFYGLRRIDLQELEGHNSTICFLWDGQAEPLLVPFADFEDVFQILSPADDGQYKLQVYLGGETTELYIAGAGRFNAEGYFGWSEVVIHPSSAAIAFARQMTHSQVQTLLGAIGARKGHEIWIPPNDRSKLDWILSSRFDLHGVLPQLSSTVDAILSEVDVIWLRKGSSDFAALFEIEHSTPVYSGLLRFNDFHLVTPTMKPRFSVVSNDTRRSLFARQVNRPTFTVSGLSDICTFLEYENVYEWWRRLTSQPTESTSLRPSS